VTVEAEDEHRVSADRPAIGDVYDRALELSIEFGGDPRSRVGVAEL
jgi:hypothetical protein